MYGRNNNPYQVQVLVYGHQCGKRYGVNVSGTTTFAGIQTYLIQHAHVERDDVLTFFNGKDVRCDALSTACYDPYLGGAQTITCFVAGKSQAQAHEEACRERDSSLSKLRTATAQLQECRTHEAAKARALAESKAKEAATAEALADLQANVAALQAAESYAKIEPQTVRITPSQCKNPAQLPSGRVTADTVRNTVRRFGAIHRNGDVVAKKGAWGVSFESKDSAIDAINASPLEMEGCLFDVQPLHLPNSAVVPFNATVPDHQFLNRKSAYRAIQEKLFPAVIGSDPKTTFAWDCAIDEESITERILGGSAPLFRTAQDLRRLRGMLTKLLTADDVIGAIPHRVLRYKQQLVRQNSYEARLQRLTDANNMLAGLDDKLDMAAASTTSVTERDTLRQELAIVDVDALRNVFDAPMPEHDLIAADIGLLTAEDVSTILVWAEAVAGKASEAVGTISEALDAYAKEVLALTADEVEAQSVCSETNNDVTSGASDTATGADSPINDANDGDEEPLSSEKSSSGEASEEDTTSGAIGDDSAAVITKLILAAKKIVSIGFALNDLMSATTSGELCHQLSLNIPFYETWLFSPDEGELKASKVMEVLHKQRELAATRLESVSPGCAQCKAAVAFAKDSKVAKQICDELQIQAMHVGDARDDVDMASIHRRRASRSGRTDADRKKADLALEDARRELGEQRRKLQTMFNSIILPLSRHYREHLSSLENLLGEAAPGAAVFDISCTLSDFSVVREVGTVMFATEVASDRAVVIKRFTDPNKFAQEMKAYDRVKSAYVAEALCAFRDPGTGHMCLVLPEYKGGNLAEWVPLMSSNPAAVARVFMQLAEGVAALHDHDLVHCDIKPQNIMMTTKTPDAVPKILDFDVSSSVKTDTTHLLLTATKRKLAGTHGFVAPEVADAAQAGDPSEETLNAILQSPIDVYGLGRTISVVLTDGVKEALGDHCSTIEELLDRMQASAPGTRITLWRALWTLGSIHDKLATVEAARVVDEEQLVACDCCTAEFPAKATAACSSKVTPHRLCGECLASSVKAWAELAPAEHAETALENGEVRVVCRYACNARIDEVQLARVAGAAALSDVKRVQRIVAEYMAIEEMKREQERTQSRIAVEYVSSSILGLRCPNGECRQPCVIDFEKCMALTCPSCGWGFCGWCLDGGMKLDMHTHIGAKHPGKMFAKEPEWRRVWACRQKPKMDAYLDTLPRSIRAEVNDMLPLWFATQTYMRK